MSIWHSNGWLKARKRYPDYTFILAWFVSFFLPSPSAIRTIWNRFLKYWAIFVKNQSHECKHMVHQSDVRVLAPCYIALHTCNHANHVSSRQTTGRLSQAGPLVSGLQACRMQGVHRGYWGVDEEWWGLQPGRGHWTCPFCSMSPKKEE